MTKEPTPDTLRTPRREIPITQEIIETSIRRDSGHCMIADAIAKQIPKAKFITVDLATIRFSDTEAGIRYIYLTPRPAQLALIAFDQGEHPKPFTLHLRTAHILPTGSARKARTTIQTIPNGGGDIYERRGGTPPPTGPLAGSAPTGGAKRNTHNNGAGHASDINKGKRRRFGVRNLIE